MKRERRERERRGWERVFLGALESESDIRVNGINHWLAAGCRTAGCSGLVHNEHARAAQDKGHQRAQTRCRQRLARLGTHTHNTTRTIRKAREETRKTHGRAPAVPIKVVAVVWTTRFSWPRQARRRGVCLATLSRLHSWRVSERRGADQARLSGWRGLSGAHDTFDRGECRRFCLAVALPSQHSLP